MANAKKASSAKKDETKEVSLIVEKDIGDKTVDATLVVDTTIDEKDALVAPEELETLNLGDDDILKSKSTDTPTEKESVKPKSSPEGMAKWLEGLFTDVHKNILTLKDMKTYKTSSDHEITVAMTKLKVARTLIGTCITNNGGKVPNFED